ASMEPTMLLGLCLALLFSVAETHISQALGRMPMGAELPRGVRFVIFLCWLMIVCGFACFWHRAPKWAGLVAIAAVIVVLV
ncbi:translation initiation factor 2, partial [Desulfovibrio desulfuricans]|nr:translation initiation factor 2 [Desulfovibrio desulfuricans]